MTVPSFPSSLPGPVSGSLDRSLNDGIVKDEGEIGAARRRRRTTRVLKQWSFTMRVQGTEKDTFETFYQTTIDYGIKEFNWTLEGTTYRVQMGPAPDLTHVEADIWDYSLAFEEV